MNLGIFAVNEFVLVVLAVAIAGAILGFASVKGGGFLKKQGVAWAITGVMVLCAIGIGYARAPMAGTREPAPAPDYGDSYHWEGGQFLLDNADVLSDRTLRELDQRNERLWNNYNVTIGVVTCNYGRDDLDQYAMKRAEEMGLGGYDMIVALDISGDNYWLIQGSDISGAFTDQDCSDYAYEYMEYDFARGFYGDGLLSLTEALESWYEDYFD